MSKIHKSPLVARITPAEIACVFVLYYPDRAFPNKIEALANYGYKIVVVSNGADEQILSGIARLDNVDAIENEINVGLATALNQGIALAFDNVQVKFVALFDQDSEPFLDLPETLANEFVLCFPLPVACIGPQLADMKSAGAGYRRHNQGARLGGVPSVPTSGSVISREAYERVGPMMDALFIDGIDHEWCLRASAMGLRILVSEHSSMLHNMGDAAINWFGHYKPLYRNPIRHYYIVRNGIYLGLHGSLPFKWRCIELLKILRRIPVYLWASNDLQRSLRLIFEAFAHGVSGKLGPLSETPLQS